ncbi:MAG: rod shape-determining protein [Candidatus Spechtbacteria bacterium RIFCSPHIGHO2_02_FULL_43_15b]|uniref:Cell shape-determining protein MreB n=1 Tax=Candidatus Spechtbacteria bacterium RIFCSPHIGHO2_01_FULL_43_30 TaxID=1802158 RepID=A0A1G2H707_9BACT|nr:MAG: rod shape-determining protein [Candidatus Spechtbacteria bacterium RIFCSPHIGHO2_01_FULL_43_30]OGZ60329.1 MAG: rod shape-determining protein [Candidatus Spechtbacteria bacterium RIFCSPHIGHO2_02_FULL_43_15b]
MIFDSILGKFSKDIGIDLGTANTLVYVKGRGIMINEPSVVALNQKTGQILAIGEEARKMVGRTPAHIVASRPMRDGVISDFEVTEQMLKYFIDRVHRGSLSFMPRPRVVIGIPSGVTEVERKAVEDAARNAGAREVYLVEEPIAAAIGARLPVQDAVGSMIVDIGGGTTEIAVISLGGLVTGKSIRVAGDKMNEDIINFAREDHNILLGERTAEEIKISIGSCLDLDEELQATMRGRDLVSGLPKEILITDSEVRRALEGSVKFLVSSVKETIEDTPPELLADIMRNGIILAGGGCLLRRFDEMLQRETKVPVKLSEDPLTAVVRGTGIIVENIDRLRDSLISSS